MAPYKSDAQRRLFHAKLAAGEIDPSTVKEFDQASQGMNLPERVIQKKKPGAVKSISDLRKLSKIKFGGV